MLNRRHTFAALLLITEAAHSQSAAPPFDPSLPGKVADAAIQIMERVNGTKLDYSAESLHNVDRFILSIRGDGKDGAKYERLLNVLGFYVGEVMARGYDLKWDKPTDVEAQHGAPAYSLRHSSGRLVNPIGKVFKLFQNGEEDRTHHLYVSLADLLTRPLR